MVHKLSYTVDKSNLQEFVVADFVVVVRIYLHGGNTNGVEIQKLCVTSIHILRTIVVLKLVVNINY